MRGLRTLLRAVCPSAFPGPSQAQSAQSAVWGQCRAYSLPCQAQQMQFSTCLSTRMTHLMAARHVAQPGLAGLHLAHFRQPQILAQAGVMPWAVRGLAKQVGTLRCLVASQPRATRCHQHGPSQPRGSVHARGSTPRCALTLTGRQELGRSSGSVPADTPHRNDCGRSRHLSRAGIQGREGPQGKIATPSPRTLAAPVAGRAQPARAAYLRAQAADSCFRAHNLVPCAGGAPAPAIVCRVPSSSCAGHVSESAGGRQGISGRPLLTY